MEPRLDRQPYVRSLLLFLVFCLLVVMGAVWELKRIHEAAYVRTVARLQNDALLVSEWVKGAFQTSDYLLRDVVSNFPQSELDPAQPSAESHARWVRWLDAKRQTLPHANSLGLFSPACIRRYTHDARVQSHFDASERDYCRLLREHPEAESVVTPLVMSNFGHHAVAQARRIPGPGPMGKGFAVIGLDTTMFSALLDRIDSGPDGVVTLIDYRQQVVARKPVQDGMVGQTLSHSMIEAFIHGPLDVSVGRHLSHLDGQPQLGVLRKVEGLPLIVYQGEHDSVWLRDWHARIWKIGLAALLLLGIAALLLRGHWAQLDLAARLERDIAQRQRLEDELKISEKKFRTFVEQANDIIYTLDLQGCFQYVSPNWRDQLGSDPAAVIGQHYTRFVHPDDWSAWHDCLLEKTSSLEYRIRHAEGGWCWHTSSLTPLLDEQQRPSGILGVTRDISRRKASELALRQARDSAEAANRELQIANAQLSNLATTDTLTGAWNRRYFEQELQRELIQSHRYGEPLSLLMFDIDHFKAINDRYGHPMGDAVLVGLTRLVQHNLRAADTLARWGGEEFILMMPHCDAEEAVRLAEKLRVLLAEQAFETVSQVTASFGVAQCWPDDSPQSLIKRVDRALYQAKADGRNVVRLFA